MISATAGLSLALLVLAWTGVSPRAAVQKNDPERLPQAVTRPACWHVAWAPIRCRGPSLAATDHPARSPARAPSPTGRSERSVIDRGPRPMPTMPDCTSSLIPKGSSTRTSAKSLSLLPVASIVTVSVETSTALAWNSLIVSIRCVRVSVSARTLTSSSSRCTEAAGSSSTIFSTLTSLLSCLVTCSSGCSAQLTAIVMREISSCSVGPTASESMLKPRRANKPAIRTSTPGLFSTSTESVWVDISYCLPRGRSFCPVPIRCHVPRELDVVVARAGRNHRPHHRVVMHNEVDDDGAVIGLGGRLDHVVHVFCPLAAQASAAVCLGELNEVGDASA